MGFANLETGIWEHLWLKLENNKKTTLQINIPYWMVSAIKTKYKCLWLAGSISITKVHMISTAFYLYHGANYNTVETRSCLMWSASKLGKVVCSKQRSTLTNWALNNSLPTLEAKIDHKACFWLYVIVFVWAGCPAFSMFKSITHQQRPVIPHPS